jgi:hypothetical protein
MLDHPSKAFSLKDNRTYFDDLYSTVRGMMLKDGFVAPSFQLLRGDDLLIVPITSDVLDDPDGKDKLYDLVSKIASDPLVTVIAHISEAWMTVVNQNDGGVTRSEIIQVVIHRRGEHPVGRVGTVIRDSDSNVIGIHDQDGFEGAMFGPLSDLFGGANA